MLILFAIYYIIYPSSIESYMNPITPKEAAEQADNFIPDEVISSFNKLIAQDYSNGRATVYQADAIDLICEQMKIERGAFNFNWLNIEQVFRRAGWKVEYEKPCIGDTFKAFFQFQKK